MVEHSLATCVVDGQFLEETVRLHITEHLSILVTVHSTTCS